MNKHGHHFNSDASFDSKRVKFAGTVNIREYKQTMGDHPDVGKGVPVCLDWEYLEEKHIALDEHQKLRLLNSVVLTLSSVDRRRILERENISEEELINSEMEVLRIKKQRFETSRQSMLSQKVEEAAQSTRRKLNRAFRVPVANRAA